MPATGSFSVGKSARNLVGIAGVSARSVGWVVFKLPSGCIRIAFGSQAYRHKTCLFGQQYGASGGVVFQGVKLSLYTVVTASRAVEVSCSATGRAAVV